MVRILPSKNEEELLNLMVQEHLYTPFRQDRTLTHDTDRKILHSEESMVSVQLLDDTLENNQDEYKYQIKQNTELRDLVTNLPL